MDVTCICSGINSGNGNGNGNGTYNGSGNGSEKKESLAILQDSILGIL